MTTARMPLFTSPPMVSNTSVVVLIFFASFNLKIQFQYISKAQYIHEELVKICFGEVQSDDQGHCD